MRFKRCVKCTMPNTRPGIVFNEEGACSACVRHEERKNVDWSARFKELKSLCDQHRKNDGKYDCIIPVSGGKDSHFQVYMMKEIMGMNPLLVNVANFSWTGTGRDNYNNMLDVFDCECISLNLSPATAKKMFRYSFEKYGSPTWYWDRAVYTYPLYIAQRFNIPLVVYGENISYEYGGPEAEDTPSAKKQILNNVASEYTVADYAEAGIDLRRTKWMENPLHNPESVEPVYLSYFVPWSGVKNLAVAKAYGFKELGPFEERNGYVEQYDQIDAVGYLVHCWMKYPKFGHARATDVTSYWIRDGYIQRDRAMELVRKHDHVLDYNVKHDFCEFCGYEEIEFDNIVQGWYNPEIFDDWGCDVPLRERFELKDDE
jgi:N-acetyl sugar amidotransferase